MATVPAPETESTTPVKTKKVSKLCECGCGGMAAPGKRFLPGHDAKLKAALIAQAVGGDSAARTRLESLGWSEFLAKREAKLAQVNAKAEARANAQAEREAAKVAKRAEIDKAKAERAAAKEAEKVAAAKAPTEIERPQIGRGRAGRQEAAKEAAGK